MKKLSLVLAFIFSAVFGLMSQEVKKEVEPNKGEKRSGEVNKGQQGDRMRKEHSEGKEGREGRREDRKEGRKERREDRKERRSEGKENRKERKGLKLHSWIETWLPTKMF